MAYLIPRKPKEIEPHPLGRANVLMLSDDEAEHLYAVLTSAKEEGLYGETARHISNIRETIFLGLYTAEGQDFVIPGRTEGER